MSDTYKSYYISALIAFLTTLIATCLINYHADPAHLFDAENKHEKEIAKYIISGMNVTNISNYDERILQNQYIRSITDAPNIITTGSSRSMMVRKHLFGTNSFFNNSVSGASLEDHMAIYQIYHEQNLLPDTIILGMDPWVLNGNNDQNRWQSISEYYYNILHRIGINNKLASTNKQPLFSNKYLQLLSFTYLTKSLQLILKKIKHSNRELIATKKILPSEGNTKLSDGSLVYGNEVRNRTIENVRTRAIGNAKRGSIYALNNFMSLNSDLTELLGKFIQIIIDDGVTPVIFLPPYHPLTYQVISSKSDYKSVIETEKYIRLLANKHNIKVFGSYDPNLAGCNDAQFTDDMHPKEECINSIFSRFNNNLTM